jgi:hypothetical protein
MVLDRTFRSALRIITERLMASLGWAQRPREFWLVVLGPAPGGLPGGNAARAECGTECVLYSDHRVLSIVAGVR